MDSIFPGIEKTNVMRRLDTVRIIETADNLAKHIGQRLPSTNLAALAAELAQLARDTVRRVHRARQPIIMIRVASGLVISLGLLGLWYLVRHINARWEISTFPQLFDATDAGFNFLVILTGALWFSISLEARIKRKRILSAIQELREFIHVIDTTQLYHTSEMYHYEPAQPGTPVIIDHNYLLFCTQMFGLMTNLAALYTRGDVSDSVMRAASDVEALANALTDKLYAKAEMIRVTSAQK